MHRRKDSNDKPTYTHSPFIFESGGNEEATESALSNVIGVVGNRTLVV